MPQHGGAELSRMNAPPGGLMTGASSLPSNRSPVPRQTTGVSVPGAENMNCPLAGLPARRRLPPTTNRTVMADGATMLQTHADHEVASPGGTLCLVVPPPTDQCAVHAQAASIPSAHSNLPKSPCRASQAPLESSPQHTT